MRRAPAVLVLALLLAGPAAAVELERGDLRLDLVVHLRSLYTFTRQPRTESLFPGPADVPSAHGRDTGLLLTRARISLEGSYGHWLSGVLEYDNEWRTGTGLDTLGFDIGKQLGTGTWLDADHTISDHENLFWRHQIYRAWLRYESEGFELKLGRQRIALGRGRLWNPSDLFNPIPPLAVEGDQRIGQDAAVARVRIVPELWGMFIWSPQDDPDEHRAALRLELSRTEIDAALMAGRIREDYVFGADFAANVGDAALRGEATFTHLERGGRIWQAVASLDYTFSVGTGLYTLVEHFYNENLVKPVPLAGLPVSPETGLALLLAAPGARQDLTTSRLFSRVRNRTGVQLSYDLSPITRGSLLWLHDWHGPSEAIVPAVVYQARSDLELSIGVQLFLGRGDKTEYGDVANLFFVQVDAYF